MKILQTITLAVSTLSLTACLSTQPPVITQQSNEVYQFDDNASFALNVAQMTRKTAGLSDVELPEEAQFKANRGLVGAEYAMSFLTGGLVDLAGSVGAQSQADRAFNWKPMFVFLGDLDSQNIDADAVQVVERELTNTFNNIDGTQYLGLMRAKSDHLDENFLFAFKGKMCDLKRYPYVRYSPNNEGKLFTDIKPEYDLACVASIKIEVVGKVDYKEAVKDVVTVTFHGAYAGVTDMAIATSGFAVVPQTFGRWGSGVKYTVPAPYVIHNNTMFLFTKENSSFKLN